MRIANNISALQSSAKLKKVSSALLNSSARLSSGVSISSSKDGPASLSIANKIKNQLKGIEMANRNTLDGISMIQTAEGALSTMHSIVKRMRELAVQSANDTNSLEEREKIQLEIDSLKEELDSAAGKTEFNGIKLLKPVISGDGSNILKVQAGQDSLMEMDIELERVDSTTLGLSGLDYTSRAGSSSALDVCDNAISMLSEIRGKFGAYENRLSMNSSNLGSFAENTQQTLSRIVDTDMAREMVSYSQNSIISQAATSILSQANQRAQQILQLLN
ncbi:MAG: flagellin [Clostridiales bacterium]|nr:flagellin [Clostridiales bacterium]